MSTPAQVTRVRCKCPVCQSPSDFDGSTLVGGEPSEYYTKMQAREAELEQAKTKIVALEQQILDLRNELHEAEEAGSRIFP